MEQFRVCQRKGCEKPSVWACVFKFRNDQTQPNAGTATLASTVTLCHEHRHHFSCRDLITPSHFDKVNAVAFVAQGLAPAIMELTLLQLVPYGDVQWN